MIPHQTESSWSPVVCGQDCLKWWLVVRWLVAALHLTYMSDCLIICLLLTGPIMGEHNRPPPAGPRPLPPLQLQQLRGAVQCDRAPRLPARLCRGHLCHCGEFFFYLADVQSLCYLY